MIKKPVGPFLAALLILTVGLGACSDNPTPVSTEPLTPLVGYGADSQVAASGDIKIGLMGPFTGPGDGFGTAIDRGAQMAVDDVNRAGGINGRKVALIKRDDQSKPDLGVQNITDLIYNEKVLAVFGTANSAVGIKQAPIANQSKVPWVIPVTTGPAISQDVSSSPSYIFRNSMTDTEHAPFAVEYAIKAGFKRIAVLSDTTAYGQGGRMQVLKALKVAGMPVVADEKYDVGYTQDQMKPILRIIKGGGADLIINWGLGPEAVNIRKAQAELEYLIPTISSWGVALPNYSRLAGSTLANGTLIPETFLQDTPPTGKGQEFVARYKEEFHTEVLDFPSGLAQAYDGMHMLLEAVRQPGAASDRARLRDTLENLAGWDGIIKKYEYPWKLSEAKRWHEALRRSDFVMAMWQDGKLVKAS